MGNVLQKSRKECLEEHSEEFVKFYGGILEKQLLGYFLEDFVEQFRIKFGGIVAKILK